MALTRIADNARLSRQEQLAAVLRREIPADDPIVLFNASLNGSLAYSGKNGSGSLTATGPVRWQPTFAPVPSNPAFLSAPLTSLAVEDRAGASAFTASGPERYKPLPGSRINLIGNGSFETNTTGWAGQTSTLALATNWFMFGGQSVKITHTSAGVTGGLVQGTGLPFVVIPGQQYTISAYFYHEQASPIDIRLGAYFYDAAFVQVGAPTGTAVTLIQPYTPTRVSITVTPHAGSCRCRITAYQYTPTVIGTSYYVDGILAEAGASLLPYFDGASGGDARWIDPVTGYAGTAYASPSFERAMLWTWEGTTNTIPDPSFEAASISTNWTAFGAASIAKSTIWASVGSNSGRITCTASTSDGMTQATTAAPAALTGQTWTLQAKIIAFSAGDVGKTVRLNIQERTAANALVLNNTSGLFTLTAVPQLVTHTVTLSGGGTTAKVAAQFYNGAASAVDVLVDDVQLEQKPYATPYADGTLGTGHTWAGTAHASTSTRTETAPFIVETGRIEGKRGSLAFWASDDVAAPVGSSYYLFRVGNGAAGSGSDNFTITQVTTTGQIRMGSTVAGVTTNADSGATPAITTPYFVYAEWDGESFGVRVNNAAIVRATRAGAVQSFEATAQIYPGNAGFGGSAYPGGMYGMQIFDQPLQPEDVTILYNGGVPVRSSFTTFANKYMEPPRVNYVQNPRAAIDTSLWTANVATLSRVIDTAFSGGTAFELVATADANAYAVPISASFPLMPNKPMTVSLDIKLMSGASDWRFVPKEVNAGVTEIGGTGAYTFTVGASVQRVTFTYVPSTVGTHKILFQLRRTTAAVSTIRFSNVIVEEAIMPSSITNRPRYFDGADGQGVWINPMTGQLGTSHASPSVNQASFQTWEATTNLIINPGAEVDVTTGVIVNGTATITRDTTYAHRGVASFKCVTGGTNGDGFMFLYTASLTGAANPYTPQVKLRGSGTIEVWMRINYSDVSIDDGVKTTVVLTDSWQTIKPANLTLNPAKTTSNIVLMMRQPAGAAVTFWADDGQLEQKAYSTDYADGSMGTGYTWAGTAHASASTRAVSVLKVDETGLIDALRGAHMVRANYAPTPTSRYFLMIGDGTAGKDRFAWRVDLNGNARPSWVSNAGAASEVLVPTVGLPNMPHLFYTDWIDLAMRAGIDAVALTSGARLAMTGDISSALDMHLGSWNNATGTLNGQHGPHYIFNRPLSDAERAATRVSPTLLSDRAFRSVRSISLRREVTEE